MSTTKLDNIINPEVMGDMIEAKINALAKLTPYAKVDTTLVGTAGDTKTVPAWGYIGDAEDFDPETASDTDAEIETTNLTATSKTFTVKCAAKSVSILQTAINSGLGDPVGQAESQLAKSIMAKVDNDLLAAAYTASNIVNLSDQLISYDGIVDGVTKFEDEEDGIDKVLFINPKQEAALLKDPDFLSADKFVAGVAVNGAIGKVAGCWVKKSKKVKEVAAEEAVAGVYTVTLDGTWADDDTITIAGTTTTLDSSSAASVTAAAAAVATAMAADTTYTVTSAAGVVTLTEKSGKEGTGVPAVSKSSTSGTTAVATTTAGSTATFAHYVCPIIKLEADNADTDFTEEEAPALTIFLKKDTQVDHEWFPKKQKHDITAAKYYGTALTNEGKVVLVKFGKVAQA